MKWVNEAIPKTDGLALVTGQGVYTDDLAPKDCLIVKVLRSPHAFARIKSIRKDAASRVESFFEESAGSRVDEELSSAGDRARSR